MEAVLALQDLAGDRVSVSLLAPAEHFSYRPFSVARPFGLGQARQVPLADVARDLGLTWIRDGLAEVDDAGGLVRTAGGDELPFEALLVAVGAKPVAAVEHALTWWPEGDPDAFGGLLRDLQEGYVKSVAFVVPPGAVWPLPTYELALMTMRDAAGHGHESEDRDRHAGGRAAGLPGRRGERGHPAGAGRRRRHPAHRRFGDGTHIPAARRRPRNERRAARGGPRRRCPARGRSWASGTARRRRRIRPRRGGRQGAGRATDLGSRRRRGVPDQVRWAGHAAGAARRRRDRAGGRRGGAASRAADAQRRAHDRRRATGAGRGRRRPARARPAVVARGQDRRPLPPSLPGRARRRAAACAGRSRARRRPSGSSGGWTCAAPRRPGCTTSPGRCERRAAAPSATSAAA